MEGGWGYSSKQHIPKYFLVTLDEEKGKELDGDSDIDEKDMDEEKVKKGKEADDKEVKMAKGVEHE